MTGRDGEEEIATTLGRVEEKATETPEKSQDPIKAKSHAQRTQATEDLGGHGRCSRGPLETTKQGGKADLTASCVVKFQNILSWCQCVSIAHTVPSILWFVKSGNCYSSVLVIYYDLSFSKAGFS